jgi:FKBP-type peptidyl-prolyl cis-trans isomerase 2
MKREGRRPQLVRVIATTGDMVLLDTNHPLAGKALSVEVELLGFVADRVEMPCRNH